MVETNCPLGGCDYSGTVKELEAHISGSRDENHSGHSGAEFREELVEAAEDRASEARGDSQDESAGLALLAGTAALAAAVFLLTGEEETAGSNQMAGVQPAGAD
jgi:hypothetical protein